MSSRLQKRVEKSVHFNGQPNRNLNCWQVKKVAREFIIDAFLDRFFSQDCLDSGKITRESRDYFKRELMHELAEYGNFGNVKAHFVSLLIEKDMTPDQTVLCWVNFWKPDEEFENPGERPNYWDGRQIHYSLPEVRVSQTKDFFDR